MADAGSLTITDRQSDVGRRYVTAAIHTGIGGILSRMLQGFTPIVLARYLGPQEYGVYTLVMSLVGMVVGVSLLGQSPSLQKFLPEYSVRNVARGGAILTDTIIIVSGALAIVCAVFFLASGRIATAIYHDLSLTRVFQFSALLVLALCLFNLASSAAAGLQDFKTFSYAMVIRSGGFLLFGWFGVRWLGLYGALTGQLAASAAGVALLGFGVVRLGRQRFSGSLRPRFSHSVLAEIFWFSIPPFLSGLLISPSGWWANTVLARNAGFRDLGLFGVAYALSQLIVVLPSNLLQPSIGFMSEAHASAGIRGFGTFVNANLRVIWVVTMPLALGGALIARPIIGMVFGHPYLSASLAATTMSLATIPMMAGAILGKALTSSGRVWQNAGFDVFWLVSFGGMVVFLVPRWGATGLALSFAISYLLDSLGRGLYCAAKLGTGLDGVPMLTLLAAGGGALTVIAATLPECFAMYLCGGLALVGILATEWFCVLHPSERTAGLRALGGLVFSLKCAGD
jgi:O-antigen/teichoic acid export membrane protein